MDEQGPDQRSQERLQAQLAKVAPGTELREGIDMILAGRTGALVVIGDLEHVEPICNGGFSLDAGFTPQRMFELAKMDGAIIIDGDAQRILYANVHLVPDHTIPTEETGMRHRAAERVSTQTNALVISVSERRDVVHLYLGGRKIILEETEVLLAKANQALQTLQRYRSSLDETLDRLTLLEFDDLVTLGDLSETISRFEMVRRVGREVNRYIGQLGTEGRLVRMQAEQMLLGIDEVYGQLIRDYAADPATKKCAAVRKTLSELTTEELLEAETLGSALGISVADADEHIRPRGYRALSSIPMLPTSVVGRIVERFGSLTDILRAGIDDLDDVDGVGSRRAAAIMGGLARLRAHLAL